MIQRVQTLLWLEVAFLSISLLFVPVKIIQTYSGDVNLYLMPLNNASLSSSIGHYSTIILNFIAMIVCFLAIFNFKKRSLQVKLSYLLIVLFLCIGLMIAFCPLVSPNKIIEYTQESIFAYIVCAVAAISSFIAARFVKKDIELLRSADRIR